MATPPPPCDHWRAGCPGHHHGRLRTVPVVPDHRVGVQGRRLGPAMGLQGYGRNHAWRGGVVRQRLHLHAQKIVFKHPVTLETMVLEAKAEF